MVDTLVHPDATVVKQTYTTRRRLNEVKVNGTTVAGHTYDAGGRRQTRTRGNGIITTWSHDAADRISGIDHAGVQQYTYGWTDAGDPLFRQDNTTPTRSESWSYDGMHRVAETRHGTLVGNTVPTPWHFDFWGRDKAGNWTNKGAQTYTHGDHHEVTASSHIFDTITYDGNMNMSADGGLWTYEYDAEDRLKTVRLRSDGSLRSEYAYDALGRRVYKGGYGGWMRFWYDGQRRIEDYDLVWNVVGYRYFYGEYVDEPVVMDNLHWWGGRYWYHTDHLFNVVAMTGTTGAVAERIWYYQPFGEFISYDGNWTNAQGGGSRVANPFLYTGREYDGESGTYYYRARTFHPVLGRFLQRDPLGYVDGPNLYEYVSGRATTAVDPEGTWQQDMHFHMTYYLARLCGLTRAVRAWGGNTMSEAYVIAWHNQYTDDHSETMPGKSPFTESNRAHFHFRGGVVVAMSRAMTAIADHAVQMAYGDRLRGTGGSPETMAMWLMPRFR